MYSGVSRQAPRENYPTLEQIDSVVKNDIPRVIEKQVVVEKPVEKPMFETKNWVLFGVNFKLTVRNYFLNLSRSYSMQFRF